MRKFKKYLFICFFIIVICIIFMLAAVNPAVAAYAQSELETLTVKAVNAGVSAVMDANTYSELTDILSGPNGNIIAINANYVKMNKIAGDIAAKSQENLDKMTNGSIPVPIGTFSGIPILTGKGPAIKLNFNPIGSVNCRFDSTFISAGINQTHLKISLYVDTVVNLILPLSTKRTEVAIQILFAESVIVGEVPEVLFTNSH